MVPLFSIKAQHQALESELLAAFTRVLRSGHFILGAEVQGFERQVAEALGVRHAIGVSSGTDALLLALMALGIGPGDEVLCPSFTFFATAGSVARVGGTPIFVDSCPTCFNLDVTDAAAKVTSRTKAIIPVHLFGQTAEMDAVLQFARERELAVIEDAAQAFGAEYKGRQAGAIGTFGTFSFFPTKNLGGFGDAGALATNDDALAEQARLLRNHGAKERYYHQSVGGNFRLDALQAALLGVKLPHCRSYTERRSANAAFYTAQLGTRSGVRTASLETSTCMNNPARPRTADGAEAAFERGAGRLILPIAYPHGVHIWNQYTVRVPGMGRRDRLRAWLAARQIGSEVYYPVPLHRQRCFASAANSSLKLPVAEALASECLSLPVYPELTQEELGEVVTAVAEFLKSEPD